MTEPILKIEVHPLNPVGYDFRYIRVEEGIEVAEFVFKLNNYEAVPFWDCIFQSFDGTSYEFAQKARNVCRTLGYKIK